MIDKTDRLQEVLDRTKRIETRLTKYLEAQGFNSGIQRPFWRAGTIEVPSMSCSVQDLLGAIPHGWSSEEEITVTHKGRELFGFFLPE